MLLILEEVARSGVPLTPTDVNAEIGLPKPTIHRLFATLEAEGFLIRELDGRSYTAGRRLRRLSVNVLSSLRVRTARLAVLG
ncbi:MAG: helix-turn-helix domain-containing protein, partial [Pseudomonadota bacterium]